MNNENLTQKIWTSIKSDYILNCKSNVPCNCTHQVGVVVEWLDYSPVT